MMQVVEISGGQLWRRRYSSSKNVVLSSRAATSGFI